MTNSLILIIFFVSNKPEEDKFFNINHIFCFKHTKNFAIILTSFKPVAFDKYEKVYLNDFLLKTRFMN